MNQNHTWTEAIVCHHCIFFRLSISSVSGLVADLDASLQIVAIEEVTSFTNLNLPAIEKHLISPLVLTLYVQGPTI